MGSLIKWFQRLPEVDINLNEWTPFIRNDWFRRHFMKVVYVMWIFLFLAPNWLGLTAFTNNVMATIKFPYLLLVVIAIFIIHEMLHIIVINKKGDISFTYTGFHFWLDTNTILSKTRFWVFMSLPYIVLSVVPAILSFFSSGHIKVLFIFISWFNLIISSSDIINSFLIFIKPKNSIFCKGFYRERGINPFPRK